MVRKAWRKRAVQFRKNLRATQNGRNIRPSSERADSCSCFTICSTTNFSFLFLSSFFSQPGSSFTSEKFPLRRQVNTNSLFDSTFPNFLSFHHSFFFRPLFLRSRETKDDNRREESTWCDLDCRSNFISVSCRLSPTRPSERFASARSIGLVTRANQRRDNLNANVCEENVSWGNHILLEQRGKGRKGRGFEVFDDGKIFIVCEGEWYFRFHIAV